MDWSIRGCRIRFFAESWSGAETTNGYEGAIADVTAIDLAALGALLTQLSETVSRLPMKFDRKTGQAKIVMNAGNFRIELVVTDQTEPPIGPENAL